MNPSFRSSPHAGWKPLYILAAIASLLMVLIILVQMASFMTVPPPLEGNARDWFAFFEKDPLMGLVGFELLMVVYVLLSIPVTLGFFAALHNNSPSWMLVFVALNLVGVICFIAARPALEMLRLSQAYITADETGRLVLLAAGEATLAAFHGLAFQVSYLLGSLTGMIIWWVMLRDGNFGKTTPWLRLGSSICDLGLYIPVVGMYISIFSVFFLVIFNLLVVRRLLQLSRTEAS